MVNVAKVLAKMRENPRAVRFSELHAVCCEYFGVPRQNGTSHAVFRVPWAGDPRVNLQRAKDGSAKYYQVKQVLAAIDKLDRLEPKEGA
jgi:hypothetical protein